MFISVDLPAPFSPSRAWTSPGKRSKSIPSLATTPGKRFVIDRSSRIGPSLIRSPFYGGTRGADRVSPPLSACRGCYFAGGREDDLRLLADLVERDLFALRLVAEGRIVRVAEDDRGLRVSLLDPGSVAAEVADDRRHRVRADRAGDVGTGLLLEHESCQVADEVASFLLLELDSPHVRRLRRKIRVVVDVDSGELHVRELGRDLVEGIAEEEARSEDELVPILRRRLQVRKALGRRPYAEVGNDVSQRA